MNEKKPLFELSSHELEEELSNIFKAFSMSHPIRSQVAVALMAAEATTQRLALRAIDQRNASEQTSRPECDNLVGVFEAVEMLNRFFLEGQPCRIDLVVWDAAGYIHGWFVNEKGQLDAQVGSCPEVVAKLATLLHVLAKCEDDWCPTLERYAASLISLIRFAREKAEIQARVNVESQNWFKKMFSPTSMDRELISLGFR